MRVDVRVNYWRVSEYRGWALQYEASRLEDPVSQHEKEDAPEKMGVSIPFWYQQLHASRFAPPVIEGLIYGEPPLTRCLS
jgi:hypothetical protein